MADSTRKTANLFDGVIEQGSYGTTVTPVSKSESRWRCRTSTFIDASENLNYSVSLLGADNDIFCVVHFLNSAKGKLSEIEWSSAPFSFTTPSGCHYIDIIFKNEAGSVITPSSCGLLMVNEGSTALPYAPYWQHSLRKLTTATEAVENPLYSDGTAITSYTISGNTVQNGTPTPDNPVDVNGVGVRTENLLNDNPATQGDGYVDNALLRADGSPFSTTAFWITEYIPVSQGDYYYYNDLLRTSLGYIIFYDSNKNILSGVQQKQVTPQVAFNLTKFTIPEGVSYIRMNIDKSSTQNCLYASQLSSFIPYGYKIPISSGGLTTNIYLGSTQTVRQIKKLVLTGDEEWNYYGDGDDRVFFIDTVQDYAKINANICICSHYPTNGNVNSAVLTQYGVSFYYGGAPYRLYIKDTSISDVLSLTQYLETQYSAGTPVTVWYVLATPETAAVNEPLMKIGTYSDTLSNATAIPTTEGANSITVDTTVQPSEFTATWTGWHDASVKEWDGSQWNE